MPVVVTLDAVMRERGATGRGLARRIGISETQMSLLRSGKVKGVRFETVAKICNALDCKPGDFLEYEPSEADALPQERGSE